MHHRRRIPADRTIPVVLATAALVLSACVFDTVGLTPPVSETCGDGVVDPGEQCDDGNTVSGDGCSATCQSEASPDCGDGNLDPGEGCDDGNTTDCDGCSATCTNEGCGNLVLECDEQCDDGNTTAGDGCDTDCQIEVPPGCGNGQLDAGEQCDDGNTTACDGCSPACRSEGCGNLVLECDEQCDDGNTQSCDGCSDSCRNEGCGNNTVECGEQCDDGNNDDCDGCSASCDNEGCGNGVIECGELCEPTLAVPTCADEGYVSGNLTCAAGCMDYDISQCKRYDGQACTSDTQCDSGTCLEETSGGMPGGYCTTDCFFVNSCPTDTVCRSFMGWDYCLATCSDSSDCRQGYYCRIDPDDFSELVCMPLCTADADCPVTGNCNVYNGRCVPDPPTAAGDNGAGCFWDGDCKGWCWDETDGNYCTSECNVSNPACPGDGVCTAVFGGGTGDLGMCLDGCVNHGDCTRSTYSCEPNPYGGPATVCWETP